MTDAQTQDWREFLTEEFFPTFDEQNPLASTTIEALVEGKPGYFPSVSAVRSLALFHKVPFRSLTKEEKKARAKERAGKVPTGGTKFPICARIGEHLCMTPEEAWDQFGNSKLMGLSRLIEKLDSMAAQLTQRV